MTCFSSRVRKRVFLDRYRVREGDPLFARQGATGRNDLRTNESKDG